MEEYFYFLDLAAASKLGSYESLYFLYFSLNISAIPA